MQVWGIDGNLLTLDFKDTIFRPAYIQVFAAGALEFNRR
jgi:hypothetical protein